MKRYIVELEPGVYLSDSIPGDPPRTLVKMFAARWITKEIAEIMLKKALKRS